MANGTEIRALELGEQIAQKQNVYIVDVTYKKADDTYSLCYYIDKEGGIGIDECELFSKAVEELLDAEDFIEENFIAKSDFKGVFSLNQSNAVIDQQISDEEINIGNYQAQIEKYKSKIESINKDKTSKFNSLINHCWNQRRTRTA